MAAGTLSKDFYLGTAVFWNCWTVSAFAIAFESVPMWIAFCAFALGGTALILAFVSSPDLFGRPITRQTYTWKSYWKRLELWLENLTPSAALRKENPWLAPFYIASGTIALSTGVLLPLIKIWMARAT